MNMLKHTEVTIKISWVTKILLFVISGMGMASFMFMVKVDHELKEIVGGDMPVIEAVTQIMIYKLEQTHWVERALRHAEVAVYIQKNNEENRKLFWKAEDEFKKITVKVKEKIKQGEKLAEEVQKSVHTERMKKELRHIDAFLKLLEKEYDEYDKHILELFSLFKNGKVQEAESLINETEKHDDDLNHRMEAFLIEIEEFTEDSLLRAQQHEDKAIFIIAVIISISLLLGGTLVFWGRKKRYRHIRAR